MPAPTIAECRAAWARVQRLIVPTGTGPEACWEWRGAYNEPSVVGMKRWGMGLSERPRCWVSRRAGAQYVLRVALCAESDTDPADVVGLEAAHRCGNRRCVRPSHGYFATAAENRQDRYGERRWA